MTNWYQSRYETAMEESVRKAEATLQQFRCMAMANQESSTNWGAKLANLRANSANFVANGANLGVSMVNFGYPPPISPLSSSKFPPPMSNHYGGPLPTSTNYEGHQTNDMSADSFLRSQTESFYQDPRDETFSMGSDSSSAMADRKLPSSNFQFETPMSGNSNFGRALASDLGATMAEKESFSSAWRLKSEESDRRFYRKLNDARIEFGMPPVMDSCDPVMNQVYDRSIFVKIHKEFYSISCEVLYTVFSRYGILDRVERLSEGFHSTICFQHKESTLWAFEFLNGMNLYDGCCQLELFLAKDISRERSKSCSDTTYSDEVVGFQDLVNPVTTSSYESSEETKVQTSIDSVEIRFQSEFSETLAKNDLRGSCEYMEIKAPETDSVLQGGVPYESSHLVDHGNQNSISAIMDERIHMEGDIDDSIEDAGQESDNEEAKIIQSDQPGADSIRGTEFSIGLIPNVFEILITANNVSGQAGNGNLVGRTCLATVELTVDGAWVRKNSVEINAPKVFEEMSDSGIDVMSRDSWNLDPGGLVSRDVRSADVELIPMSEYSHSYHLVFDPGGGLNCEASADSFIDIEISSEQQGCNSFTGIAYYDLRLIKNGQNSLPFDRGRVAIDIVEPQEDSKAVTMNSDMGSNVSKVIPGSLKAIVVEVTPQEMSVPCFWKIPVGYDGGVANKLISVLDYGDISTLFYVESSGIADLVDKHWVLGANWIFDSGRGLPLTLVGWIQCFLHCKLLSGENMSYRKLLQKRLWWDPGGKYLFKANQELLVFMCVV